jgi:hypothetical protein
MLSRRNLAISIAVCLILTFVGIAIAQQCLINAPKAVAIYKDALTTGWDTSGSWGTSINPQYAAGGQDGAYAIQGTFTGMWTGMELHKENISTSNLDAVVFKFMIPGGGKGLYVNVQRSDGSIGSWKLASTYVPGGTINWGQWYSIRAPLSDFGIVTGTTIKGVLFEVSDIPIAYFDDIGIIPSFALFPLAGSSPYLAQIAAILDHSVDASKSNLGYYRYAQNGVIQAYNGVVATGSAQCRYFDSSTNDSQPCDGNLHGIVGYAKADGGSFSLPLLGGYQSGDRNYPGKQLLWYDGHSGYDYPAVHNAAVHAATAGILCAATARIAYDGTNPWRDTGHCPFGTDPINGPKSGDSYDGFHLFYIVYGNGTYSTWYQHSDSLEPTILNDLKKQDGGYSVVTQNQIISYVGGWSPDPQGKNPPGNYLPFHLHFEVRFEGFTEVDPYGDGTPGDFAVLWLARP